MTRPGTTLPVTGSQRQWLRHLRACAAEGQTTVAYATASGGGGGSTEFGASCSLDCRSASTAPKEITRQITGQILNTYYFYNWGDRDVPLVLSALSEFSSCISLPNFFLSAQKGRSDGK